MSNAKLAAVDDIKKLTRFLKGLSAYGEELERQGSLENATKEIQGRFDAAKAEEAAHKKSLEALQGELAAARSAAQKLAVEAKAIADKTVEAANSAAESIRLQAKGDAQVLVDRARQAAADVDLVAQKRHDQVKALDVEISSRKLQLDGVTEQLAKIRKQVGG